MKYRMVLNTADNSKCPCKECHASNQSYVGCHAECLKYKDWQQKHLIELQNIREQKSINNLLYNNQTSRNKKVKQQGGIKYGRHSNDSR
jgi:hypothetical protein